MSLVIAVILVIVIASFITNYHPIFKPKQSLAEGEILIPDATPEVTTQPEPSPVEPVVTTPQPKKRGPKPKVQTEAKITAAKKPKKKTN